MRILSLMATQWSEISGAAAVEFAAKPYAWIARISADTPYYVAVGAEATDESCYINEFDAPLIAVPAGQIVSVLGTDAGDVWVTEVKVSS